MAKREPGKFCRPYKKYQSQYHGRPPYCPCLWTDWIIKGNFKAMMEADPSLRWELARIFDLFAG